MHALGYTIHLARHRGSISSRSSIITLHEYIIQTVIKLFQNTGTNNNTEIILRML